MSNPIILLADNDKIFLSTCTEFLESAGYRVVQATTPLQARSLLGTMYVHLAILDLRLMDDSDTDRSGLTVAKEVARVIPKLILTKFPTYEDVRDAMKWNRETLPPVVDYVDKRQGLNVLLNAIQQVFLVHIRINWSLTN